METKAVVIEITKSEEFGKVGKIVAEVASYYLADAMTTGMDRMRFRGEMKGASGHIGYDSLQSLLHQKCRVQLRICTQRLIIMPPECRGP